MTYRDIIALVFAVIVVVLAVGTALAVTIAEHGDGVARRAARQPAEPAEPRHRHREPRTAQRVYGDAGASLHAAWRAVTRLVGDEEWTRACHRIRRWQPGDAEVKR